MLAWIGLALLAVSWLPGLGYYHLRDWTAWGLLVLGGTLLMVSVGGRMPSRNISFVSIALMLPALWWAPWPYRLAIWLMVLGLLAAALPRRWYWPQRIGSGAVLAGCVLLGQGLAMLVYEAFTAGSHELAPPLPWLIGAAARLIGVDVAIHDATLAMFSMRQTHLLGATWELFLDPPSLCFAVGATVFLGWRFWSSLPKGIRAWRLLRCVLVLWLLIALWLPLRSALLMAGYLEGVLRVDYEAPLDVMGLFWHTGVHLLLLAGPVLLAWRFVRLEDGVRVAGWHAFAEREHIGANTVPQATPCRPSRWHRPAAASLAFLAVGMLTVAITWDPVGQRQAGRVVVEEYHPDPEKIWERTDKPFDTTWYGHLSGYNYYCIYDYLSRFYQMSRLTQPIADENLSACDVLIIKVPTRPFAQEEIDSILRFVREGGGLLLIGEHTNVFGSGAYLNSIAQQFGFRFRYDCLFGIDSVFDERYEPPLVAHPIVRQMPPLEFATSCSIDPQGSSGRAVIRGTGLKNAMADYHVDNFYPQPVNRAEMRYGAFVQLWATRYGQGRVVAFSDSTIFSNFSAFEPGKAELMLGMVEWLNHRSRLGNPRPWLAGAAGLLLLAALWASRRGEGAWLVLVASGLLGWTVAAVGVSAYHGAAMPTPRPVRPMVQVILDRTVCQAPLPKNGFISGKKDGFGIFERWVLRLGYFTARRRGTEVFGGDLAVFPYPSRPVSREFRQKLLAYVAGGGKVLVVDSPENTESTANHLLEPFEITVGPAAEEGGELKTAAEWPAVPVKAARSVQGGRAFAWVDGKPVGASLRHGRGTVTVIGFGSRFTDAQMGVVGDVVPDEELKQVFDLFFSLIRAIVDGRDGMASLASPCLLRHAHAARGHATPIVVGEGVFSQGLAGIIHQTVLRPLVVQASCLPCPNCL